MRTNTLLLSFMVSLLVSSGSFAFDNSKDATVDKADRFDFESFHKDDAVTLWKTSDDKKKDNQAVTTYDEKKSNTNTGITTTPVTAQPVPETTAKKSFEQGQELKVRSAYKLSVDPSLKDIPTLFETIQNLHQQLSTYCPNGWQKQEEWHKPEANYFYLYYRAVCL